MEGRKVVEINIAVEGFIGPFLILILILHVKCDILSKLSMYFQWIVVFFSW